MLGESPASTETITVCHMSPRNPLSNFLAPKGHPREGEPLLLRWFSSGRLDWADEQFRDGL